MWTQSGSADGQYVVVATLLSAAAALPVATVACVRARRRAPPPEAQAQQPHHDLRHTLGHEWRPSHRFNQLAPKALADADKLQLICDFDLTLTSGRSAQCHDIVGASHELPTTLRASFEALLDFSTPFEPAFEGECWWVRANSVLVSHGEPRRTLLPRLVERAELAPRRGALELLAACAERDVPVLIVSAGYTEVIEHFLRRHGALHPNIRISSNRLVWDDAGVLVECRPSPPITSLTKSLTGARNAEWFSAHAGRTTLLVLGDRCSDLQVADGLGDVRLQLSVGILNESGDADASAAEYGSLFDALLVGNEASLEVVARMIRGR